MKIIKRAISDLKFLKVNEVTQEKVAITIGEACDKTLLIVDEDESFQGIITIGDYKRALRSGNQTIPVNKKCKCLFEQDNLVEEISAIASDYPNVRLVPVLSSDKNVLFAYSIPIDYTRKYYDLSIAYSKLKRLNPDALSTYITYQDYKKVAIWGVNALSIEIGETINQGNGFEFVGLFDSIEKLNSCKINFYNYDLEPTRIENIESLLKQREIDLLILADLEQRIYNPPSNVDILGLAGLLNLSLRHLNVIRIHQLEETLNQKGVNLIKVEFPNLEAMGFSQVPELRKPVLYCEEDTEEEFLKCVKERPKMIKKGKLRCFSDYKSKYINCIQGERLTVGQPNDYDHTIYLLGSCIADGYYAKDSNTIGSYLQKSILESNLKEKYRIVAYGGGAAVEIRFYLNWLDVIKLKEGDIVILLYGKHERIPCDYDMTEAFINLHKQEDFFFDHMPMHCNYKGFRLIADKLLENCILPYIEKGLDQKDWGKNDSIIVPSQNSVTQDRYFEGNNELLAYIGHLKKFKVNANKIGTIVMNCNPFTLGHQYLIEQSRLEVDYLYIFVVEEDKSRFSFSERFHLVEAGTKHWDNVKVIPSGKFIISALTFSAYFDKDTASDIQIDATKDVEVFAQYIAPALNIQIRFLGEEPIDMVTNQYNNHIKSILPEYGIDVKIIPRKQMEGEVISASRVRKLLDLQDFEGIKKIVPNTTYEYLLENYRH